MTATVVTTSAALSKKKIPGFILSVSVELHSFPCELINVYLHPKRVPQLAQSLLQHLRSPASRKHPIRIVGGDFNRLQQRIPAVFSNLLTELDSSSPPFIPSYRQANGYNSPLDFFLVQLDSACSQIIGPSRTFTFWPSYHSTGHGIHICKFPRPQTIAISEDDSPAIPTSAFYLPPSLRVSTPSATIPSLAPLIRDLLSFFHLPCLPPRQPYGPGGELINPRIQLLTLCRPDTFTLSNATCSSYRSPSYCFAFFMGMVAITLSGS